MKNAGDKIDMLEVMNEPAGFLGDAFTTVLRQYYIDSYNAIRTAAGNNTVVMFSDGFQGLEVSAPTETRPLTGDSSYPAVLGRVFQASSI